MASTALSVWLSDTGAAGSIQLVLAKRGFVLPNQSDMSGPDGNGWMGSVIVPVSGETHFNIQIMQK